MKQVIITNNQNVNNNSKTIPAGEINAILKKNPIFVDYANN